MNRREWAECVLALRAFYPHSFKLDDSAIGIWFGALEDLPGDRVKAAIVHMGRTTKAFPSLAEIRQHAEPSAADHSEAWGRLVTSIQRIGAYTLITDGREITPEEQLDPDLREVVKRLGGWSHVCKTFRQEDEPTNRAQFRRIWEGLQAARKRDETFAGLGLPNGQSMPLLGEAGGQS